MTIAPYVLASTIAVAGTIGTGITRAVTLGTGSGFAVPYPGYRTRILRTATGLGGLNVLGKLVPGWADWEWSGTAWVQTASGGLL